ncbi:hypothetical protein [uncultured Sphingomonas sp.]|uniref:hypothetical protein n=1 Tax=uncultured Sphingomonas sp. TaxID=158754 RepID=UPI0035CA050B
MSATLHLLDSSILVHLQEGWPAVLLERVQMSDEGLLVASTIAYAEVMLGAVRVRSGWTGSSRPSG